MSLKLLVLSCLLAGVFASDVIELGDSDFDSKLADMDAALVMFYAPWCGHCKRLKPEFAKASTELKANDPPVNLVQVDCTEAGKDTCGRFSVTGYPTLKIFKGGELTNDYNGPREAAGITKYMKGQVGPASKELKSLADTEAFLAKAEVGVVYFGGESSVKEAFMGAAGILRESTRFAHVADEATLKKYGFKDEIVLFRPKVMSNKFEPDYVKYEGADSKTDIKTFVKSEYHGLVGHRTTDNAGDFRTPLIVAYYVVDYAKNAKGTNYIRNRILKVAQNYKSKYSFAVAHHADFAHELEDFGKTFTPTTKAFICARDAQGLKYIMDTDFSFENLEAFMKKLTAGDVEPFIKSEPVPEKQGNVIVAVGKNFDEVVTHSGRDALIEFYAPWCGHCKKLTPVYEELGEKMANEDVDIIKMDATANDIPPSYNVRGFPTIYWKPSNGAPMPYDGGRELKDFVDYIAKRATDELEGYSRDGKPKKTEL